MSLNQITLNGRLVADAETKQNEGITYTNIRMAVPRPKRQGEEGVSDFFNVSFVGRTAEVVSKYFGEGEGKGKPILVTGRMQSRKWTNKDGQEVTSWEVRADSFDFIGNNNSSKGDSVPPTPEDTPDIPNPYYVPS